MKLHIICFKNVLINAFTTPNFTDLDPEVAAKQLERSIVLNQDKQEQIRPYRGLDMYHIADFDDETGVITPITPVLISSPRELLLQLEAKKINEAKKEDDQEVAKV